MSQRNRILMAPDSSDNESSDSTEEEEYRPTKVARRTSGGKPRPQPASQSDNSQLSSQCSDLSDDEFKRCSNLVANYFITAECKKIPIKRADLGKVVGKQHVRRLPLMIEEASRVLYEVYGYKIQELEKKKNQFLLVNTLAVAVNSVRVPPLTADGEDVEDERTDMLDEQADDRQGLLFLILTVVFMMGDLVEEVTLVSFLKCLGVYVESKDPHPVFGNCKKVIEDYVKQCYLDVTVMKDLEPPTRQYSWGERAHLQVCKRSVLEVVCKVYGGDMRPEDWVDQWAKIVGPSAPSSSSTGSSVEEISMEEVARFSKNK